MRILYEYTGMLSVIAVARRRSGAFLSEGRIEALVRLAWQVDGDGSSRDALGLPASAPRGVLLGGTRVIQTRLPPRSG